MRDLKEAKIVSYEFNKYGMKNLLIINASPRDERSVTRRLTSLFATKWIEAHPDYTIRHREVGRDAIPHVSEL
ncbi:NAD(P)H-dependent oxidoreductase [Danxiaibacter flavus]|uniref:NAD(P)H-dependent oxidoreductase n=1 Tax=Danxiaibacter flavus TaxID=3049108 RepID=UPI0034E0D017